jgi:hypothetical protein
VPWRPHCVSRGGKGVNRCSIGGCVERSFAHGWCLGHYSELRRIPKPTVLAIRASTGPPLEVARAHGVRVARVWEIRHARW